MAPPKAEQIDQASKLFDGKDPLSEKVDDFFKQKGNLPKNVDNLFNDPFFDDPDQLNRLNNNMEGRMNRIKEQNNNTTRKQKESENSLSAVKEYKLKRPQFFQASLKQGELKGRIVTTKG
jgi:hypothetical protein